MPRKRAEPPDGGTRILVGTVIRPGTAAALRTRNQKLLDRLEAPEGVELDVAQLTDGFERQAGEPRWAPAARARTELINRCLTPEHSHVLWLDADVADVPKDVISRLLAAKRDGVVAPRLLIEGTDAPYNDASRLEEDAEGPQTATCVSGVYLVPASLYRAGGRHTPKGRLGDAEPLCEGGATVLPDVVAEHANLPNYEGEGWH